MRVDYDRKLWVAMAEGYPLLTLVNWPFLGWRDMEMRALHRRGPIERTLSQQPLQSEPGPLEAITLQGRALCHSVRKGTVGRRMLK